jgi:hypothetical protein
MSERHGEPKPDIATILKPDSFERMIRGGIERAAAQVPGRDVSTRPALAAAGGRIVARSCGAIIRLLRAAGTFLRLRRR